MNKSFLVSSLALLLGVAAYGKDAQPDTLRDSWKVTYYVDVAYGMIYVTRENEASREGEEYFFPKPVKRNDKGVDVNAVPKLEMKSISTQLGMGFVGPKVIGAIPSGAVEIDYFALLTELAYMPRLKTAYLALDWQREGLRLLAGHYGAVTSVGGFSPQAKYTGAGVAFAQMMRQAQLRLSWSPVRQFDMALAAGMHTYHGYTKPRMQQQKSGRPDVGGYLFFEPVPEFAIAASAGARWFKPRVTTLSGEKSNVLADSYDTYLYMRVKVPWFRFVASGSFGKNIAFAKMLGGYGYDATDGEETDFSYSGLYGAAGWCDVHVSLPAHFELSCFTGYYQQLGAERNYTPLRKFDDGSINPTRGDDIQMLFRVVPELSFSYKGFTTAVSYHFDTALYGENWDAKHQTAEVLTRASNHRAQLILRYKFSGGHSWSK